MLSVIDIVAISRSYSYWNAASFTVVVTDYLICLPQEVELVWPTRWSAGKVLYFATRYSPFLDGVLLIFFASPSYSTPTCQRLFTAAAWLTIIGMVISEAVLIFRTWAVWGGNIRLFIILFSFLLIGIVLALVFAHISLSHVEYGTMAEGYPPGCWLVAFLNPLIIFDYIIVLCVEIIVLILTLYKCRQAIKKGRSKLLVTLHRDAILYCFFIVLWSVANIVNQVVTSSANSPSFEEMQRVMHSVLTARILLNLRQAVQANELKSSQQSTMDWEAGAAGMSHGGIGRSPGYTRARIRPRRTTSRGRGGLRRQWNMDDSTATSSSSSGIGRYLSTIVDLDEDTWTHDEESAMRVQSAETATQLEEGQGNTPLPVPVDRGEYIEMNTLSPRPGPERTNMDSGSHTVRR